MQSVPFPNKSVFTYASKSLILHLVPDMPVHRLAKVESISEALLRRCVATQGVACSNPNRGGFLTHMRPAPVVTFGRVPPTFTDGEHAYRGTCLFSEISAANVVVSTCHWHQSEPGVISITKMSDSAR